MLRKLKKNETMNVVTKETVKPFIKWAGGKTKLLPEIAIRLPNKWSGNYFEPFIGGGAFFFWLRSSHVGSFPAHLTDINVELINAYTVLRNQPKNLIAKLEAFKHSERHYYKLREMQPFGREIAGNQLMRAARFIYLNKTCFNGLYRVNSKGLFNVPIGDYKNPLICDKPTLLACSAILSGMQIGSDIFENTIDGAMRGDFIYCDPPYLPKTETAEFTSYTKEGFTLSDHERLHDSLAKAHKRGARWMLSEGDSPFIRKLFKSFNVMPVNGKHSVAASADSRGKSKELLITNYKDFMPWHVAS